MEKPAEQEVQKKPEPDVPEWTCQLYPSGATDAPQLSNWTVGDKFLLNCKGDFIEKFTDNVRLEFPVDAMKYSLVILEKNVTDHQSAQFIVTGYKPGQYKPEYIYFTDGSSGFKTKNLEYVVQTVIKNPMQQPYGSYGPFSLSLPWWIWGVAGFICLLVILFVIRMIKRNMERRRILDELARHATALSPFNQLNKDIRQLRRGFDPDDKQIKVNEPQQYMNLLDKSYRLFLVRQLKVPALDWSLRDVMADIRKRHRKIYDENGGQIRKLLIELTKSKSNADQITKVDCEQLTHMAQKISDSMYKNHRKEMQ